jgi:hypothetical protein
VAAPNANPALMINAGPERVMAWWYHTDRFDEFKKHIESLAAGECSVTQSTADGVRVRVAHWKNDRGWDVQHRIEAVLAIDGWLHAWAIGLSPLVDKSSIRSLPRVARPRSHAAGGRSSSRRRAVTLKSPTSITTSWSVEGGQRGGCTVGRSERIPIGSFGS